MYEGLDEHSPSKELIDTCWNVNIESVATPIAVPMGINRYMLECK